MRKLLSVFTILLAACVIPSRNDGEGSPSQERGGSLAALGMTQQAFDPAILRDIDHAIETAITEQKAPGAVFHLEQDGAIYEKAYGNRSLVPEVEPMTADTMFDAASLTKVTATTPAIWLLVQRGKIASIDDPVQKYIPEFPHADVTLRHLLTHTSGLRPDLDLKEPWKGYDTAMKLIMKEKLTNKPGFIFRYSDINFELLGEVVRRVSGEPLDVFTRKEIFEPLGMKDTGFRPHTPDSRIAPTEMTDGVMLRGIVHDPTARRMGGVAGHAGLFTTTQDLAKYCRMLLRGGSPIFKPEIVKLMTTDQSPKYVAVKRTGGFDLDSSFSTCRGDLFPMGSYGHTGWTGGAYWIDPASNTFYILMTNRVHPNGKGNVVPLRHEVATLAARAVGYVQPVHPRVTFVTDGGSAMNGIDEVVAKSYEPLKGMRIGLITNQTGIDKSGNPTIDLLRSAPGINVVALFSPEHGIRGLADEKVSDSVDPASGLPIYSLYGETRNPKPEQLANLDALVFDIQDVGARFYTYISALGLAMEAAAESHKKFIVLDRVDPIGGSDFEGPILKGEADYVGWHPIVIRYGMTPGELAQMYRAERHIDVDLTVVPIHGWKRNEWQDEAGLPWINTSPNMRNLNEAALYPGLGLMESAISVGRGTPIPFEIFGAPYIDENRLAHELPPIAGVTFTPVRFTPNASNFAGQECGGLRITITDRKALRPVSMGVAIATTLYRLYPDDFAVDKMERLLRDPVTLDDIKKGITPDWSADEAAFGARREKVLLYR